MKESLWKLLKLNAVIKQVILNTLAGIIILLRKDDRKGVAVYPDYETVTPLLEVGTEVTGLPPI